MTNSNSNTNSINNENLTNNIEGGNTTMTNNNSNTTTFGDNRAKLQQALAGLLQQQTKENKAAYAAKKAAEPKVEKPRWTLAMTEQDITSDDRIALLPELFNTDGVTMNSTNLKLRRVHHSAYLTRAYNWMVVSQNWQQNDQLGRAVALWMSGVYSAIVRPEDNLVELHHKFDAKRSLIVAYDENGNAKVYYAYAKGVVSVVGAQRTTTLKINSAMPFNRAEVIADLGVDLEPGEHPIQARLISEARKYNERQAVKVAEGTKARVWEMRGEMTRNKYVLLAEMLTKGVVAVYEQKADPTDPRGEEKSVLWAKNLMAKMEEAFRKENANLSGMKSHEFMHDDVQIEE